MCVYIYIYTYGRCTGALASGLSRCRQLQVLDLRGNKLSAAVASPLGRVISTQCQQMAHLEFGSNFLREEGTCALVLTLAARNGGDVESELARRNAHDTCSQASSAPVPGEGWACTAEGGGCVAYLGLRQNFAGDRGALALAFPPRGVFQCLLRLDLSGNLIGDKGMVGLARAMMPGGSLTALQRLDAYENAVRDAGATELAAALIAAPALSHLDLRYNNISAGGVAQLQQARQKSTDKRCRAGCGGLPPIHLAVGEQVGALLSARTFDGVSSDLIDDLLSRAERWAERAAAKATHLLVIFAVVFVAVILCLPALD